MVGSLVDVEGFMAISHLPVSIGVFAHNEEKNIQFALASILKQKTEVAQIKEIIVVSSGSYDHTNALVKRWAKKDNRIVLIEELERQGKSSSINTFLRKTNLPIVVAISADLRLHPKAIEEIVMPFLHDDVGMVGAHPVPANTKQSQIGGEIALLWELHHQISLVKPKCGEMVAFRNVIRQVPIESAVDEATIEVLLQLVGYKTMYAPRSIVYNRGPKTIKEYLKQRRRVYNGHQWVKAKYNYEVVTLDVQRLMRMVAGYLVSHPDQILILIRLILLEVAARVLGWLDHYLWSRNPYKWDMIDR